MRLVLAGFLSSCGTLSFSAQTATPSLNGALNSPVFSVPAFNPATSLGGLRDLQQAAAALLEGGQTGLPSDVSAALDRISELPETPDMLARAQYSSWAQALARVDPQGEIALGLQGTGRSGRGRQAVNARILGLQEEARGIAAEGIEALARRQAGPATVGFLDGLAADPAFGFPKESQPAQRIAAVLDSAAEILAQVRSVRTYGGEEYLVYGAMERLFDHIVPKLGRSRETVLITGETGTGKEMVALAIHDMSGLRKIRPINVASLNPSLVASDLFGHVKGAYTGAVAPRIGYFEDIGDGTLYLDEIGDLNAEIQAMLLRVVQQRTFTPLGSNGVKKFLGRLLAATNRNLKQMGEDGRFREDLRYRLGVLTVHLPPLRERKDEIIPLAKLFIRKFNERHGTAIALSRTAAAALAAYNWPGNIRELENLLISVATLLDGFLIRPRDLPSFVTAAAPGAPAQLLAPVPAGAPVTDLRTARESSELQALERALTATGNNRMMAAARLGISRMGLYKKMHKYGLMERFPSRQRRR